ncbi:MAG TPA: Clp protease N-terminal domain-containing protein [Amycolatopsis sp.]|uniref:Clp protease N-terminal domain-containing protein n=1 Tax=Amycolatopsis sp. TaxID=37632 RepID=UPI002B47AC95|nr:Clp protease N-terminal domain-containing protein [Amycolatopsis sp.]HKS44974.1 Clp protease N-terminal domain-containing protein [Amycolatopsis sp.]
MMFERFTPDARTVVVHAQEHARRLGHRYVGCEHLLLAVVSTSRPASAVLREQGMTPDHVEEEIVRRVGLGGGAGLFSDLDREALSAIGIDLDAVRARIEASFGTEALTQAANAMHRRPRLSRLNPRRAIPPGLLRRWRRRRRPLPAAPVPDSTATGRYQAMGAVPRGHLPLTTRAKKCLENSVREAQAMHDQHIGVEHVALGVITMNGGLVAPILLALGASGPALRAAILDRYRRAS